MPFPCFNLRDNCPNGHYQHRVELCWLLRKICRVSLELNLFETATIINNEEGHSSLMQAYHYTLWKHIAIRLGCVIKDSKLQNLHKSVVQFIKRLIIIEHWIRHYLKHDQTQVFLEILNKAVTVYT